MLADGLAACRALRQVFGAVADECFHSRLEHGGLLAEATAKVLGAARAAVLRRAIGDTCTAEQFAFDFVAALGTLLIHAHVDATSGATGDLAFTLHCFAEHAFFDLGTVGVCVINLSVLQVAIVLMVVVDLWRF